MVTRSVEAIASSTASTVSVTWLFAISIIVQSGAGLDKEMIVNWCHIEKMLTLALAVLVTSNSFITLESGLACMARHDYAWGDSAINIEINIDIVKNEERMFKALCIRFLTGYVLTTVPFSTPKGALQRSSHYKWRITLAYWQDPLLPTIAEFSFYTWVGGQMKRALPMDSTSTRYIQTFKPDALAECPPIARPGPHERIQKAQVVQDEEENLPFGCEDIPYLPLL